MNSVDPIRDDSTLKKFERRLSQCHPKYIILWSLGLETGLRISDLLQLRVKDVSCDVMTVNEKKTKKCRTVSIAPSVLSSCSKYASTMRLAPENFLIYSRESSKDKPLSRVQAWKTISRCALETGLKFVGTHSMRKTYAILQYASHGDINALQNDFQHRDKNTTLKYLISNRDLLALIRDGFKKPYT